MTKRQQIQQVKPEKQQVSGFIFRHSIFPVSAMAAAGVMFAGGSAFETVGQKNLQSEMAAKTAHTGEATLRQLTSDYYVRCEQSKRTEFDAKTGVGHDVYSCGTQISATPLPSDVAGGRPSYDVQHSFDSAAAARDATIKYNTMHLEYDKNIAADKTQIVSAANVKDSWKLCLLFGGLVLGTTLGASGLMSMNQGRRQTYEGGRDLKVA